MSHLPSNKKIIEDEQRNTNIHMHKRKFGQILSPRESRGSRQDDYPNDSYYRKTKRFKDSDYYDNKQGYDQGRSSGGQYQSSSRDASSSYQRRSPPRYEKRGNSRDRYRNRSRSSSRDNKRRHYKRKYSRSSSYSDSRSSSYHKRSRRSSSHHKNDRRKSRSDQKQSLISSTQNEQRPSSFIKQERNNSSERYSNNQSNPAQDRSGGSFRRDSSPYGQVSYPSRFSANKPLEQIGQQKPPSQQQNPTNFNNSMQFQQNSTPPIQVYQAQQAASQQFQQQQFTQSSVQQYPQYPQQQQNYQQDYYQQKPASYSVNNQQQPSYQDQSYPYYYNQNQPMSQQQQYNYQNPAQSQVIVQPNQAYGIQQDYNNNQNRDVEMRQEKKGLEPRNIGVIYYSIAKGDFEKWKDYLYKIFGNNPQISKQLFDQCKEDFTQKIEKDKKEIKSKFDQYFNESDINKKVNSQINIIQQQEAMKDEDASTQEDIFEPQEIQKFGISEITPKSITETMKKVETKAADTERLRAQMIEAQNKREALKRKLQIHDIRLSGY